MKPIYKLAFLLLIAAWAGVCLPLRGQAPPNDMLSLRPSEVDYVLPFYEPWDQGTFAFNNWSFIPSQGNWQISTTQGNPAPTAVFSGTPALLNYAVAMESEVLPGEPWYCAVMYLEFDYKLQDIAAGGTEKLIPEYFVDNTWYPLNEITNQGSTGWIHEQIDISQVCGKNFRIRFNATGQNSANMTGWSVDNIRVEAICKGPENLSYIRYGNRDSLYWHRPACDSIQFLNGFNVFRTDTTGMPPFHKLNASPVAAEVYVDVIPSGITNAVFRYYVTAIYHDMSSGTVLCEAPGDTITVDYALGLKEKHSQGITIYPQPAKDYFVVGSDNRITSVELLNLVGQTVFTLVPADQHESRIPVAGMAGGIYLLKVETEAGRIVRKVVVE